MIDLINADFTDIPIPEPLVPSHTIDHINIKKRVYSLDTY